MSKILRHPLWPDDDERQDARAEAWLDEPDDLDEEMPEREAESELAEVVYEALQKAGKHRGIAYGPLERENPDEVS